MPFKYLDRVKETTATTGSGAITPAGAVTGFRTFSGAGLADTDTFPYVLLDANGTDWETGFGTYNTGNTISRTLVVNSTNGGAAIVLSSGTHTIFLGGNQNGPVLPGMAFVIASEALSAGNWVNIWSSSGSFRVRKADATASGKEAHGFVRAAVSNAATALVYLEGVNDAVSGQTPGAVFLATTAGAGTATAPSGSGNVVQTVGVAVSATAVKFVQGMPVVLA